MRARPCPSRRRAQRAGGTRAPRRTWSPLELHRSRPLAPPACDRRTRGLHRSNTRAGTGHPARPRRTRRARRRPDGHRQDGGVHPADPAALASHANSSPSPARHPIRAADPDPHPRAGRQIGESVDATARAPASARTVVYGGVPPGPAGQGAAARRRDPRRHTRPPARPDRPAAVNLSPGRDPRPRRGRPHAGHGLHRTTSARPSPWSPSAARPCCSRRRSRTPSASSPASSRPIPRSCRSLPATRPRTT